MTLLAAQQPPARPSRDLARLSDEALLSLVASSDDDALAALYDRFGRVAYGLALRILRDETLAQDAVQEAFLGVWRNADRFLAERAKASTWILTLVHRRAVDLVRREDIRRAEPLEHAPEPAEPRTAEDEASLGFQRRLVQEALSQLPAEQREALELGYYGGLTQSELAERLDQPLGTIKSRMFTGLSRLPGCSTRPISKARTRKIGARMSAIAESLKGRSFTHVADWSRDELLSVLDLADDLKERQARREEHHLLPGRTLAMIFQKPSTRTRVSFEVGMTQLGGHALYLAAGDLQLGRGETLKDTATVLSRYVDGIMIRTFEQDDVEELAPTLRSR